MKDLGQHFAESALADLLCLVLPFSWPVFVQIFGGRFLGDRRPVLIQAFGDRDRGLQREACRERPYQEELAVFRGSPNGVVRGGLASCHRGRARAVPRLAGFAVPEVEDVARPDRNVYILRFL